MFYPNKFFKQVCVFRRANSPFRSLSYGLGVLPTLLHPMWKLGYAVVTLVDRGQLLTPFIRLVPFLAFSGDQNFQRFWPRTSIRKQHGLVIKRRKVDRESGYANNSNFHWYLLIATQRFEVLTKKNHPALSWCFLATPLLTTTRPETNTRNLFYTIQYQY